MGDSMFDTTDFRERYKKEEIDFASAVEHTTKVPIKIVHATENEDKYEHWDIKIVYNNAEVKFDVKAMKRKNRADSQPDPEIQWIELKGITGHDGWVNGKADYIAFEQLNDWIIVRRDSLTTLIKTLCIDDEIHTTKEMYVRYQRSGRKDEIVLIKTADLDPIIAKRILKNT